VRLERFFLAAIALLLGFQFHKGAIRTKPIPVNSTSKTLFQFHKGAIRTSSPIFWLLSAEISIP